MNTYANSVTRLARVGKIGAAIGAAILTASALQAQNAGQAPSTPSAPSADTSAEISHRGKEFLNYAAQANQTEIVLADVAREKAQSATVKDLAKMLRTDHQQNNAQLQAIAQIHGVTLDTSPDWLNQREIDRLRKANNADFDQEYTKAMLKGHVKCVERFDKAVAQIKESDINQYAQSTLPTLRSHLRHAEEAARSAGVDESTISALLKGLPPGTEGVTVR